MDMNSGYNGFSMSKNAVSAYDRGEKPLSKWTKADIITEAEADKVLANKEWYCSMFKASDMQIVR